MADASPVRQQAEQIAFGQTEYCKCGRHPGHCAACSELADKIEAALTANAEQAVAAERTACEQIAREAAQIALAEDRGMGAAQIGALTANVIADQIAARGEGEFNG